MSKEKLEECFKGYLEQANNLGERGFCKDTDDYQEFLKDAIDELFGYMYECGFSANKKQAECYKQLQRKTAECEELRNTSSKYYVQVLDERDKLREEVAKFNEKLELIATCGTGPLKEQNKRYKHALEEIEGIVNKKTEIPICDECAYRNIPECKENCMQDVLGEILDIISKAMEG